MTISYESANEKVVAFLEMESSEDSIVTIGSQLLGELRRVGKYIQVPEQRDQFAKLTRQISERLLDVSGKFFPSSLDLWEPPLAEEAIRQATIQSLDNPSAANKTLPTSPLGAEFLWPSTRHFMPEGFLSSGSRIDFARNPLFIGREEVLEQIRNILLEWGQKDVVVCAVTGMGGIGKTQVASEFVHRYGQEFTGGVFWLNFSDPGGVRDEIADCGNREHLNLGGDFDEVSIEEKLIRVKQAWEGPEKRLLIFDNCEDEELLAEWRPITGGCRILLTSRRVNWSLTANVHSVPVSVLNRRESILLLCRFRPDLSSFEPQLDTIAEQLGDLPLALHLAGGFLRQYRNSPLGQPEAYIKQLQTFSIVEHPSLQGKLQTPSPTEHEQHIIKTIALSYQQLDLNNAVDALAHQLLVFTSCLASTYPIPVDFLIQTLQISQNDFSRMLQLEDAFSRLVDLGLLERREGEVNVHIHTLVSTVFRLSISEEEQREALIKLGKTIHPIVHDINESTLPMRFFSLWAHLRIIVDYLINTINVETIELVYELGRHLRIIGENAKALAYAQRELSMREQVYGNEHPELAKGLNVLAVLYHDQGRFEEARNYYERALAIWEAQGITDRYSIKSLNNLADLYRDVGELERARPLYERAISLREKMLGLDHPETADSINNMGVLLHLSGQYDSARNYYDQAYAIYKKIFGDDHPTTSAAIQNIAELCAIQGDYQQARVLFNQALEIVKKHYGNDHTETANVLHFYAIFLFDQGEKEEAINLMRQSLTIRQTILGLNHPDTEQSATSLETMTATQ